jgi:hypothetical protein
VGALNAGTGALVFTRVAAAGESWVLERLGEDLFRAHERALTAQVLGGRTSSRPRADRLCLLGCGGAGGLETSLSGGAMEVPRK